MPERERAHTGESTIRPHGEHLLLDQDCKPFTDHGRAHHVAEEDHYAALPAHLAEHAGGA